MNETAAVAPPVHEGRGLAAPPLVLLVSSLRYRLVMVTLALPTPERVSSVTASTYAE